MKMKQLASKSEAVLRHISADLQDKLNGLTINEAIEKGIIDDLGDADGKFIFEREDIDAHYALIQGQAVWCSEGLAAKLDETDEILGDLTFQKGVSTIEGAGFGKSWFRLGLPAGVKAGVAVKSLTPEPVDTKK